MHRALKLNPNGPTLSRWPEFKLPPSKFAGTWAKNRIDGLDDPYQFALWKWRQEVLSAYMVKNVTTGKSAIVIDNYRVLAAKVMHSKFRSHSQAFWCTEDTGVGTDQGQVFTYKISINPNGEDEIIEVTPIINPTVITIKEGELG